jgi:segregation and condensation protein A
VSLEPSFAALLPELVWQHTPEQFAALAAKAFAPKEAPPSEVGLTHLHAPPVSVREQAAIIGARLRIGGAQTFRALTADAESRLVVVARFLALLEMFRDRAVAFEQAAPLGELSVRWTAGQDWTAERLSEEYDDDEPQEEREEQHAG